MTACIAADPSQGTKQMYVRLVGPKRHHDARLEYQVGTPPTFDSRGEMSVLPDGPRKEGQDFSIDFETTMKIKLKVRGHKARKGTAQVSAVGAC